MNKETALNEAKLSLQRVTERLTRMRETGWFLLARTNEAKRETINEQLRLKQSYEHLITILSNN
jgi:hypothetical protein